MEVSRRELYFFTLDLLQGCLRYPLHMALCRLLELIHCVDQFGKIDRGDCVRPRNWRHPRSNILAEEFVIALVIQPDLRLQNRGSELLQFFSSQPVFTLLRLQAVHYCWADHTAGDGECATE